ncbi:MAG: hypothetical protein ACREQC_05740, partial [Candidatus Binataceae bacterium]
MVTKPADVGNGVAIAQGSLAIVTLAENQSGWAAQLQSLTVKGQTVNVSSGSASVMSSAQSTAASAANTVSSALGRFGFGQRGNNTPAVAAVASGQRVVLPPGTTLTFVLAATPQPSAPAPDAVPARATATAQSASAASPPQNSPPQAETQQGRPFFCQYLVAPNDGSHSTWYITEVFYSDALLGTIQDAWQKYEEGVNHIDAQTRTASDGGYCRIVGRNNGP